MGSWGASLYQNDCTCDVRNTYIDLLEDGNSNEDAYIKTLKKLKEIIGSDEECYLWYALAETQWKLGRLMPEVKQKALEWIERNGGLEEWLDSSNGGRGWKNTLEKLKGKLNSLMPAEKKIQKPKEFIYNPWNINDIYALKLHSKIAKERGLFGKYILIQKINDYNWVDGLILSRVHVFDKTFDELPTVDDIDGVRLLPLVYPYDLETGEKTVTVKENMNAAMCHEYKKNGYMEQYYTYIGNKPGPLNKVQVKYNVRNWLDIDDWLSDVYHYWQGVEYKVIEEGTFDY